MLFKLVIFILVFSTTGSQAAERKELLFSSEVGNHFQSFCLSYFKAYNSVAGKLKIKALDINLARAYKFLINETVDGNCARVKGFSKLTKETRDNVIELSPSLLEVRFLILAKNKVVADKLKKNLSNTDIVIGMPAGARFFERFFRDAKTYQIGDTDIGINMLAAGRLDAVIAIPSVKLFKKLNEMSAFQLLQHPKLRFEIVSIINKKNLKNKKELERVIGIIKRKGLISKALQQEKIRKLVIEYKKRAP